MQLILEETFAVENVVELNESSGQKTYVIKGTFSTPDKKNRNGRIYASKLWEDNVAKYQAELQGKTTNTLMEKEHPPRTSVDPWSAVAQIRKLEMREGLVYGEAELLNIPETAVMRELIDKGVKIGVSSRGVGKMKGDIVEEFNLITYDIVSTPSDYNANLEGFNEAMILEGVEIEVNEKGQYICTPEGCSLSEAVISEKVYNGKGKIGKKIVTQAVSAKDEKEAEEKYIKMVTLQQKNGHIPKGDITDITISEATKHGEDSDETDDLKSDEKNVKDADDKNDDVTEKEHGEDCQCEDCKAKRTNEEEKMENPQKIETECDKKAKKLAEAFEAFATAGIVTEEEKEMNALKEKFRGYMGRDVIAEEDDKDADDKDADDKDADDKSDEDKNIEERIKVNTQAICDQAKELSPENQAKVFAFVLSLQD